MIACPDGWHLPTTTEWETLFTEVGGKSAGKVLKSQTGWRRGTDAFGFSALPAGHYCCGDYNLEGTAAYFWSSTEYGLANADRMHLFYDDDDAHLDYSAKFYGFSVRCLQD